MANPSSPFAANPGRYRNVPRRVKNPRGESGCLIEVAVTAVLAVAGLIMSL